MFEEEKHPRDKEGKFTEKPYTEKGGAKYYRQNASYEEILNSDKREEKRVNLTRSDWRRFYEKLGEIKRGGYVDRTENGNKMIPLHKMNEGDKPKLIICSGSFEKPKVKMVIQFCSEEKMFETIERLKI